MVDDYADSIGSGALETALDAAVAGGYVARLAGQTYTVTAPIVINVTSSTQGPIGIDLGGAKIFSQITNGEPVIEIVVGPGVNIDTLTLSNFMIHGSGFDGAGIKIVADGADRSIGNLNINNVKVEHVGGIGLDVLGNVSGTVFNSWMHGNAQGGARFANSDDGGVADGLEWIGGGFRKNGVAGLILDNGANDLAVKGAYFVENYGPGLVATSGITLVQQSGFENNLGAGAFIQGAANFVDDTFSTHGLQKVGIGGYAAGGKVSVTGTGNEYYGPGPDTTLLANIQGSGTLEIAGGGKVVTGPNVTVTGGSAIFLPPADTTILAGAANYNPTGTLQISTWSLPVTTDTTGSGSLAEELEAAMAGGYVAHLTEETYTVSSPIVINVTSTIQGPLGIDLGGAMIVSQITDGSPVIQINAGPGVDLRYLTLSNFTIQGNGQEGAGIEIVADGNDRWIYNFNISNVTVQGVGGYGLDVQGSVFEGIISNSSMNGNALGGAYFGHSSDGQVSALRWFGGGFADNGGAGLTLGNGGRDISIDGASFENNQGAGISAEWGITSVTSSNFTDNHGPGVWFQNYGNFTGNTFTSTGAQTIGITGWQNGDSTLVGNTSTGSALANLQGYGATFLTGGIGQVTTGSNIAVGGADGENVATVSVSTADDGGTGFDFQFTYGITASGNNTVNADAGADWMVGGAGDDTYWVDNVGDVVIEADGQGTDTVLSSVSFSLGGQYIENLILTGSGNINGTGNTLDNELTGNSGNNILNGGGGNDVLTGGGGQDQFVFSTALNATSNVDLITDFSVADDTILLDRAIFAAFSTPGAIASSAFRVGAAAEDPNDRIIYNSVSGALIYDADGSGAGGAVQFAELSPGLSLTHQDFLII